jgi:hypothetical protein
LTTEGSRNGAPRMWLSVRRGERPTNCARYCPDWEATVYRTCRVPTYPPTLDQNQRETTGGNAVFMDRVPAGQRAFWGPDGKHGETRSQTQRAPGSSSSSQISKRCVPCGQLPLRTRLWTHAFSAVALTRLSRWSYSSLTPRRHGASTAAQDRPSARSWRFRRARRALSASQPW